MESISKAGYGDTEEVADRGLTAVQGGVEPHTSIRHRFYSLWVSISRCPPQDFILSDNETSPQAQRRPLNHASG